MVRSSCRRRASRTACMVYQTATLAVDNRSSVASPTILTLLLRFSSQNFILTGRVSRNLNRLSSSSRNLAHRPLVSWPNSGLFHINPGLQDDIRSGFTPEKKESDISFSTTFVGSSVRETSLLALRKGKRLRAESENRPMPSLAPSRYI
jgi:hypothetical protein